MIKRRSNISVLSIGLVSQTACGGLEREVFEWEDTKFIVSHVPVTTLLLLNDLANL